MVLKGSCERGTNKPPNLLKTQCRVTYDVDDLLQSETEFEHEGLRLVGDGPFQVVVLAHEVVYQSPLVRTAPHACKKEKTDLELLRVFVDTVFRILSLLLVNINENVSFMRASSPIQPSPCPLSNAPGSLHPSFSRQSNFLSSILQSEVRRLTTTVQVCSSTRCWWTELSHKINILFSGMRNDPFVDFPV